MASSVDSRRSLHDNLRHATLLRVVCVAVSSCGQKRSQVCVDPGEITSISEDTLRNYVLSCLMSNGASTPLVCSITCGLLDRLQAIVWSLSCEERNSWSKQRALAKAVASIAGGRIPAWADAERPGQWMHEHVRRYRARHKKAMEAERKLFKRSQASGKVVDINSMTRVSMEEELYHCKFGCTPATLPKRRVPPGLQPRQVEYVTSSFAEENLRLLQENRRLQHLESEAVTQLATSLYKVKTDFQNSVSSEHAALVECQRQAVQVQEVEEHARAHALAVEEKSKRIRQEKALLEKKVQQQEGQILSMSGHVASSWRELELEKERHSAEKRKLEASVTSVEEEAGRQAARLEQENARRKEMLRVQEKIVNDYEAKLLRQGSIISKLNMEVVARQREHNAVMRALENQKRSVEAEFEACQTKLERAREKKNEMARRRRLAEKQAETSERRLERAKMAESTVADLQHELEEMQEALQDACSESHSTHEQSHLLVMSRRDARGRFSAMPSKLRVLIWAQLGRRVPPSVVSLNIADVLRAYAPDQSMPLPCEREIQKMRGELTIAGEAIAAFRVALSKRIVSFGWDETTKFGLGLLSSNFQIETHDAAVVDVVLRGATLTAGGSAAAVATCIEEKQFKHARRLLIGWRAAHISKFGEKSWVAEGAPDPESIGLHRLSENTLLMTDTCNAARACKRLVKETAEKAGQEKIGAEVWAAMGEADRNAACLTHIGQCHQHLRNIIINAMQLKATETLKLLLQDSLAEFSSYDRLSVDGNDLIRGAFKELHAGGEYAKGKQREYDAWRCRTHPSALHMPFECAKGSRQDIAFDGAVPIFVNRPIILEFIYSLISVPGADNTLEKFLWHVLSCNEMTALLRVNTLWKYLFSEPARFLAGKGGLLKGWSIDDSSGVMDLIEQAMIKVAADGQQLMDTSFDPYTSIAQRWPEFDNWRKQEMERKVKAPDGSQHVVHKQALAEARNPVGKGNIQATARVVQLAEEMANAALVAMRDPRRAICDLLTSQDGKFAMGKDPHRAKATVGAHISNDRVESNFGCVDVLMRMFRYATTENVSGMAQQMRMHDFDVPSNVDSSRGRKRKTTLSGDDEPHVGGFYYHGLSANLQESLVDFTRSAAGAARVDGRLALQAHDEEKLARREERVMTMLNSAVERYAYAKELFSAWRAQRERKPLDQDAVSRALVDQNGEPQPEAQQLEYLRYQIEMRVLGLGWTQYATRWSAQSDQRIGTVSHLRQLLVNDILVEERAQERLNRLPEEAAPPNTGATRLRQLGTRDDDSLEVSRRTFFSQDELARKAELEMKRRVEAGIQDHVELLQPDEPPPFDQSLVGKRIEVLWKYYEKDTNESHMIWSTGRVVRVADGLTDKRSPRARSVLPAGAILWAWEADPEFDEEAGEQWLFLLPKKWNPKTHKAVYSWRYDPREVGGVRSSSPDAQRKQLRRAHLEA